MIKIEKNTQNLNPPDLLRFKHTKHTKNILNIVENTFKNHPGEHDNFNQSLLLENKLWII